MPLTQHALGVKVVKASRHVAEQREEHDLHQPQGQRKPSGVSRRLHAPSSDAQLCAETGAGWVARQSMPSQIVFEVMGCGIALESRIVQRGATNRLTATAVARRAAADTRSSV